MSERDLAWQARLSISLYKRLLSVFPARFYQDFAVEMGYAFEDLCLSMMDTGGTLWPLRLWIRTSADLAVSLFREHYAVWRCDMKIGKILSTWLGIILLGYSLTFAGVNILKYQLGFSGLRNPFDQIVNNAANSAPFAVMNALIIMGPLLALGLFILPLLDIKIDVHGQQLATITLNRGGRLSLILLGLCLFVGAIFVLYVTVENLPCLLGQQLTC